MNYVIKGDKGEFAILFRDIANVLKFDIDKANQSISLTEKSYVETNVPFLPMCKLNRDKNFHYILSKVKCVFTQKDEYCVLGTDTLALKYCLINLYKEKLVEYTPEFLVMFAIVCEDCLKYAKQFK